MERIEEFGHEGKNFVYLDFSGLRSGEEFTNLLEQAKPVISRYPEQSLYIITNIDNVRIDSGARELLIEYLTYNKPFIKYSAIIGVDGIKKMMIQSAMKQSGRDNVLFAFSKEKAIELVLKQK